MRARIAWTASLVLQISASAALAYLAIVFVTRPLHSGITPDMVFALGYMLPAVGVAQTGKILWRRWRGDYLGREARVSRVYPNSTARVWVDGVPYLAFTKEPVRVGDRLVLTSTDYQGAPLRVDFIGNPSAAGGT